MLSSLSLPWIVLVLLWPAWAVSWALASGWSAKSTVVAPLAAQWRYRTLTVLGVAALFMPLLRPLRLLAAVTAIYPQADVLTWCCVILAVAGFAFCWWARVHLGKLWSSNVARKADHRVIDTGPYAIVRHPIYTGIITAALAVAIAEGTVIAFAGVAVLATSFYIKARMEENLLGNELGPAAYDGYRARVPMLVPFWPVRRSA